MTDLPVVLHIFPTFGMGGQQRRFADLVNGFSRPFFHKVISLHDETDARALLRSDVNCSIDVVEVQKSTLVHPNNLKLFRDLFKTSNPALLCTYNWGSIEAVMTAKLAPGQFSSRFKALPHIHFEDGFGPGESPENQNTKRVLARRCLLWGSVVIVPSITLHKLAKEQWKLSPKNLLHIPNGIESDRFFVHDRVYNHTGPVTVGTVGAFRPEKNLQRLISLYDQHTSHAETRLQLVGDGPFMEPLQHQACKANRSAEISFPGATDTPEKAYQQFDIFMLTSDTEQMPISLMEAMMAGLPVVATNVGDVAAMVSMENRPFICSPGDEALLLESMERMMDDPALREKVGRANQQKARQQFDRQAMLQAYESLFSDMTGGNL